MRREIRNCSLFPNWLTRRVFDQSCHTWVHPKPRVWRSLARMGLCQGVLCVQLWQPIIFWSRHFHLITAAFRPSLTEVFRHGIANFCNQPDFFYPCDHLTKLGSQTRDLTVEWVENACLVPLNPLNWPLPFKFYTFRGESGVIRAKYRISLSSSTSI